tara:strand:+ start:357 stop:1010 length:654 start_codon:yes stop_codon:yes gene_type:complete
MWKDTIRKKEEEKFSTMPKNLMFEWEWRKKTNPDFDYGPELEQNSWSQDVSTLFVAGRARQLDIQKGINALKEMDIKCFVADLINENTSDDFTGHLHFGVAVKATSGAKEVILYFDTDTEAYWVGGDYPEIENIHLPFELTNPRAFSAIVMNRLGFNVGVKEDDRYDKEAEKELYRQLRAEEITYDQFVYGMQDLGIAMDRGYSDTQQRAAERGYYF